MIIFQLYLLINLNNYQIRDSLQTTKISTYTIVKRSGGNKIYLVKNRKLNFEINQTIQFTN